MNKIGITVFNLKNVEDLLKGNCCYKIPDFQREFSWNKDEWSDFFEDAINVSESDDEYFLGFMTFKKEENEDISIIEGQQRISTVTILIAVIRDILFDMSNDKWKDIEKNYVKSDDVLTKDSQVFYKLILSGYNKDIFKNYIQEVNKPKEKLSVFKDLKLNISNKKIIDCYIYFYQQLIEKTKNSNDNDRFDFLMKILKTVLRQFMIVYTEVTNDLAAYNIFQTLNDRGFDLTLSDLLKIYLFKKTGDSWEEAKEKWDEIKEVLSFVNVNSFLRHYWLSKEGIVKEKNLLQEIEKKIRSKIQVFEFINNLKSEADNYEALLNPRMDYWEKPEITNSLLDLQILSTQQPLSILLAACKLHKSEFTKIIILCTNFIFRYLTIAEKENKVMERLFSDIAIKIRNKDITTSGEVKLLLKKEDIEDSLFKESFKEKQITRAKVAKYILQNIEDEMSGEKEKFNPRITLEHILPRNPDGQWKKYLKENGIDKNDFVYRIGNLTLLLQRPNKDAQNKFFTYKRDEIYKTETKLKINEELRSITSWGEKDIEKRQENFSNYAVKIWKL